MTTTKSLGLIAGTATLTALSMAGSIYTVFAVLNYFVLPGGVFFHIPGFSKVIAFIIILFASAFVGGGIWGWGIAHLFGANARPLIKIGALTWGTSVFLAGLVLYFAQIPIAQFDRTFPTRDNYLFMAAFVPVVGAVAGINARAITRRFKFDQMKRSIGWNSSLATAAGFLVTTLVLQTVFGWEVSGPYAGTRYSMIKIMHICNAGASLAGGAAMGWTLVRAQAMAPAQSSRAVDQPFEAEPARGHEL